MQGQVPSAKQLVFEDLDRELSVTRTVLERLPEEHYGWRPHERSMNLGRLASHVADLPQWMRLTLQQDELDMAAGPPPPGEAANRLALLERFDGHVAALRAAVADFDVAAFAGNWSLRSGEQILTTRPRAMVYRVWCFNHLIHHRGQLCLYLRLLNVPVPTVYFNTADDPNFVFE